MGKAIQQTINVQKRAVRLMSFAHYQEECEIATLCSNFVISLKLQIVNLNHINATCNVVDKTNYFQIFNPPILDYE